MIRKYNFYFHEVAASNDAYFAACAGLYARDVVFDGIIGYCCTVRDGSICTRINRANVESRIFVAYTVNLLYKKNGISIKYWMNLLGPMFNMRQLSNTAFIREIFKYLLRTPFSRICIDVKESGNRFSKRLKGIVNDEGVKSFQKVE